MIKEEQKMGLFGKLFEKKECSICGGEIGLLGNRKLEDGNLCKECANKLSPWFDDRRHSTVEQIEEQLEYREANKEKVAAFRTTRTLGENTKILLDEDAGVFIVTRSRNFKEENPDVIAFSEVTGCDFDIDEDRTEEKRQDSEGNYVSYNPPRYTYSYDFKMIIHVRNPYFDEIDFRLNSSSVEIEITGNQGFSSRTGFGNRMNSMSGSFNPENDVDYRRYKEMGEEIKAILLQARTQVREQVAASVAPKTAVNCPYCGATTTPDASGCCEFCGGALNS